MTTYTISASQAGLRLDKYLNEQLADTTRSQIQKMIKAGTITVNDKPPSVHQFLKAGDTITISRSRVQAAAPAQNNRTQGKQCIPNIPIIADTDDYLVIDKPAGVLVHEAPSEHDATVVDFVLAKYPDVRNIGEDPMRPGIVHRLDKEVSGLLVIAKTQDMFDHLKSQFKTRQVEKWYYALVEGNPDKDDGEINFNIDRSTTVGHKMAAVPRSQTIRGVPSPEADRGKQASTAFTVIERFKKYTLLRVRPHTGRTHQIRVHLNAYGLPIVGDSVYRPKKLHSKLRINRIFLHAYHLAFATLRSQRVSYETPLPPELQGILDSIR